MINSPVLLLLSYGDTGKPRTNRACSLRRKSPGRNLKRQTAPPDLWQTTLQREWGRGEELRSPLNHLLKPLQARSCRIKAAGIRGSWLWGSLGETPGVLLLDTVSDAIRLHTFLFLFN